MTPVPDQFWEIAVRERFVNEATANSASSLSLSRGWSAEQTARDHLALSPAIIGIIQALLHPRDQIPGYELLGHLGHGGMGAVYRARQLAFNRTVALKTVLVGADANPASLQRFEQEAQTIGRLVHPHLVTAYDFTRVGGRFALAMEFLDGRDAERWRQGRLVSERQVWGLIRQAAAGLAHAAAAGVIHRDVKPSNLLLVPPPLGFSLPPGVPLLKVADFGLALLQDAGATSTRITRENATVGSPLYMSPEQLRGARVDHRADIYALGVTAYYLLTGETPLDGLSMAQICARKLHGDSDDLAGAGASLSELSCGLVRWMMQREANDRPASYEVIFQRIDEILPQLPPEPSIDTQDFDARPVAETPTDPFSATQVVPAPGMATQDLSFRGPDRLAETVDVGRAGQTPVALVQPPAEPPVVATGPRVSRRTVLLGSVAVALMVLGGSALRRRRRAPSTAAWVPSGWAVQCFDGQTITGWRVDHGQWVPGVPNDDGGRVLAGSQGAIAYSLVKPDATGKQVPLRGFRLIALVQPRSTAAAELQWALIGGADNATATRYVVRIDQKQATVGARPSFHGPLTKMIASRDLPPTEGRYEIKLELHGAQAKVYINGTELATVPPPSGAVTPEFYLATESTSDQPADGRAWFSDIAVEELQPKM